MPYPFHQSFYQFLSEYIYIYTHIYIGETDLEVNRNYRTFGKSGYLWIPRDGPNGCWPCAYPSKIRLSKYSNSKVNFIFTTFGKKKKLVFFFWMLSFFFFFCNFLFQTVCLIYNQEERERRGRDKKRWKLTLKLCERREFTVLEFFFF